MTQTILVEQAGIKTATVEIKALMVNGKQMTLAVFRQLVWERMVDTHTLMLNGIPWGWVNHCPNKLCGENYGTHLHLVWQKEDELRQWTMPHHYAFMVRGPSSYDTEYEAWRIKSEEWKRLYAEMKDLPQLFIAV